MELRRLNGEVIGVGESVRQLAEGNSANLRDANLRNTDLRNTNLRNANLRNADLINTDLRNANLRNTDLINADLRDADLRNAKIEFPLFPSLSQISSMLLGSLPDDLILELMRRDAYGHPHPELFDEWANGGDCPYQNEMRAWFFEEKMELWEPGDPTMADRDLVVAICKAMEWGIKGYLDVSTPQPKPQEDTMNF